MALPFFYAEQLTGTGQRIILEEDNSKHIVQVLRMQRGEKLLLTDGVGNLAEAAIEDPHKKHCSVDVLSYSHAPRPLPHFTIAISLIKNTSRFEWFLEKATELGTAEIIPLLCDRTEKQNARHDRFVSICKSAMLQSTQCWMPVVHRPLPFIQVIKNAAHNQKMIAHCTEDNKRELSSVFNVNLPAHIILIGPEGDFSDSEVAAARALGFDGVSLGRTRLRTETAGLYAAVMCRG